MAYRDDGEAILARLVALSAELAAAKREIAALEGDGKKGEASSSTSSTSSSKEAAVEATNMAAALIHARTRLAKLLAADQGGASSGEKLDHSSMPRTEDAACAALRDALGKILIDKLGSVPAPIASVLSTSRPTSLTVSSLTDAIVAASRTDNWNALILRVVRALES